VRRAPRTALSERGSPDRYSPKAGRDVERTGRWKELNRWVLGAVCRGVAAPPIIRTGGGVGEGSSPTVLALAGWVRILPSSQGLFGEASVSGGCRFCLTPRVAVARGAAAATGPAPWLNNRKSRCFLPPFRAYSGSQRGDRPAMSTAPDATGGHPSLPPARLCPSRPLAHHASGTRSPAERKHPSHRTSYPTAAGSW
jgi:hypothetical protein